MLVLNADDVRRALPMGQAIAAMKRAYSALALGQAQVPLRARLEVPPHEGTSLFMPAYVQDEAGEALTVKVVSVFPRNPAQGLPLIHAAVLVLEGNTGRPLALLEGGTLTAIRTGAGAGAATDVLARSDSRVAAIFGAGVQARTQLEAVCSVRTIERAWVFDPDAAKSAQFVRSLAGSGPIPHDLIAAGSPQEALREADIVCAATTAHTPVFADGDLKPGVHINGIGSYTPEMQEIPPETVARARVVVDSRSAALVESGDLIQPLRAGLFTEAHIHAELGEILAGKAHGRSSPDEITFFKSVGVAVQDAAAAQLALQNAQAQDLGQRVPW
jgi:ornithine cyclodeaminase